MLINSSDNSINKNIKVTFKGLPYIDEEQIIHDFKLIFIDSFSKLTTDQKSSDKIVSDIVKNNLKKIMKNSFQKKPEIDVHLIRF